VFVFVSFFCCSFLYDDFLLIQNDLLYIGFSALDALIEYQTQPLAMKTFPAQAGSLPCFHVFPPIY
jgi:hypothetical protein